MGAIDVLEEELKIASTILEWEMGDIWGHVGVRVSESESIAVKLFRPPDEPGVKDWLVQFDYSLKKISGVGTIPGEAAIYSEIFKARPDINAAIHSHAPMSIALSLADKQICTVHQQSWRFGKGLPIYPDPIFIIDPGEGADLARVLGQAPGVVIKGHGIVSVGKTIDEACMNALYMERTAKIQVMAQTFGFSRPNEEYLKVMEASFHKLMAHRAVQRGRGWSRLEHSAEWRYYEDKIRKGERWMRGWT